jgi:hypothetical protein
MGRAGSVHGQDEKGYKTAGKPGEKRPLGPPQILRKLGGRVWTGFIRLIIRTSGRFL